jgi:hypothetical protein
MTDFDKNNIYYVLRFEVPTAVKYMFLCDLVPLIYYIIINVWDTL